MALIIKTYSYRQKRDSCQQNNGLTIFFGKDTKRRADNNIEKEERLKEMGGEVLGGFSYYETGEGIGVARNPSPVIYIIKFTIPIRR